MLDFVGSLFREDLVPHGFCIAWQPEILWLHVVSDAFIALAYCWIPATLWRFIRRRTDVPFRSAFYLFIGVLLACGVTHAIGVVTIWKAMYGIEGIAKALTAGVSIVTAVVLVQMTPHALALRSPGEFERLNAKLEAEVATRREAQAQLTRSHAELERRVAERTAELSEAKASLEREMEERERAEEARRALTEKIQEAQRLESLGAMAEGVAHDFNNLLTVITGRAQMLKGLRELGPSSLEALDNILRAAGAAADLSGQMLVYSGYGSVKTHPVDVSGLVKDLRPLLAAAVSRQAEVFYNLQEDLPGVISDASQLRQVVMNLAINAGESAEPGRAVTIHISTGRTRLADEPEATSDVSFLESAETPCIFIEVADSGAGMDLETQRRVFDPFFSTKFAGRGLGLALVLGIVRGLGGAVRIHSAQGEGTTFRILLPATETVVKSGVDGGAGRLRRHLGSGCVLVVDDDDSVRQLIAAILQGAGYQVWTARSGPQALAILDSRRNEIGLVFLDLTMPLMSGDEVLAAIRDRSLTTPVLLTSGYDAGRANHGLTEGGAAGFLAKPFTPDELLEAVAATIRRNGELAAQ